VEGSWLDLITGTVGRNISLSSLPRKFEQMNPRAFLLRLATRKKHPARYIPRCFPAGTFRKPLVNPTHPRSSICSYERHPAGGEFPDSEDRAGKTAPTRHPGRSCSRIVFHIPA